MPIHISDKQLEQMENGPEPAVIVRSEHTKKGYAVIPESVYDEVRPLLQLVAAEHLCSERERGRDAKGAWTPEKNARRVALINKKHDQGLTAAEKRKLQRLMAEAEAYRDAAAPIRNQTLELILAGLRKQPLKSTPR